MKASDRRFVVVVCRHRLHLGSREQLPCHILAFSSVYL
jgi:hypothetical protein